MRVISQCGKFDCDYEHIAIGIIPENLTISTDRRKIIAYPVPQMMEDDFYLMGVYANEEKAKRSLDMLRNTYYNFLFQKTYKTDTNEFSTYFRFPTDEDLEV